MRKNLLDQLPLVPVQIEHVRAKEFGAICTIIDQLPEAVDLVYKAMTHRQGRVLNTGKGRPGMSAEQILRACILKQMSGVSYESLAFHLADSNTYRSFCRIGIGQKAPKKAALQSNIKRVNAETWEAINELLVCKAMALGIEEGRKVRTDCTVVESNIHHPTDSSLLWDCVRVLSRLMATAREEFGLEFSDHRRRAKRRLLSISNARSRKARKPLYRDLVKVTNKTLAQGQRIAEQLGTVKVQSLSELVQAGAIASELRRYAGMAKQVISQAERRVFHQERVPADEKLVSIFEPHTDIIIKGAREVEYGHKICLTTGVSSMVTAATVEQGNPSDSVLVTGMLERHQKLFGRAPRQVSFDGGFASQANLAVLKDAGVKDVMFHKRCGLSIEDMSSSTRIYRKLRSFRSGIEGTISFLKRTCGLGRCTWRSFASFKAYVQASVLACNFLVVARHVLAARA